MRYTWASLIPFGGLIAGAVASQESEELDVTRIENCVKWCIANKLGVSDCILPAVKYQGLCFTCGPAKSNPFEQLCGGKCVNTATDAANCGGCGNKCSSGTCCGASCSSNAGLQWAHYQNLYPRTESYWPNFDPTGVKSLTGDYNSTTTSVGLYAYDPSAQISIYGSQQTFPATEFILNHRGYLYAQQNGTYTISTTADDDIMLAWLGQLAYSGWTRSNANLESAFPTAQTVTYTASLVQGQYYPLRLMYANAGGAGIENITITDPNGEVILGGSSTANPSVIQYSCDGTTAPRYPPFGQET